MTCSAYVLTLLMQGKLALSLTGHEAAVTKVSWVYREDRSEPMVVSASQDETVRIWSLNEDISDSKCTFICRGHTAGVARFLFAYLLLSSTNHLLATVIHLYLFLEKS